jgi:hypothetical protein
MRIGGESDRRYFILPIRLSWRRLRKGRHFRASSTIAGISGKPSTEKGPPGRAFWL